MSYNDAACGIDRLEKITSPFDYGKVPLYISLAKEYLRRAENYRLSHDEPLTTPFFNALERADISIPGELADRLEKWLSEQKHFSRTVKDICRWYVMSLLRRETLAHQDPGVTDVYEPLIQLFSEGGDFYVHHGAMCIRDAAMIPFVK